MKASELAQKCGFEIICKSDEDREVKGAYACDLLSWVIGRAPENAAFITVMSNVNVIAVAVMAEASCVVLTEGVNLEKTALDKALQNDIMVLKSMKDTYSTCVDIYKACEQK